MEIKLRKEILERDGFRCRVCGAEAWEIHHKDIERNNHRRDNLVALCRMCHKGIHAYLNNRDPFVPNKNVLRSKWAMDLIKKHKWKCGTYDD
jgi:5-methylcytosine-specific restriction endonuclease McrA